MNYTDVTQVFDLLESTDGLIQITPVHLSGFVSRTSTINADGDIAPGAVNTADIQFSVLDIRGPVSSYTGREFVYRKGYAEAATREKMTTAADAYVTRDGVEYYIYGTTLTATDGVTTSTYTVTKGAGSLVLRGAELIVLYPDEPYAQRFTVDGATLTDIGAPLFVYDYDKDIAAGYARQRVSYVVADDTVTAYHAFKMFNVRYLDTTVYEVHTVGYFTFDRPKRGTGGVYTVSASDRMTAFDSDYIDVLNSVTTGTTAQQLLESLCSAAGVELAVQDRYNADLVIVVPEDLESCTGTKMLTWLGELMGCSWRINAAGQLESVWFAKTAIRLTKDDYVSFSYEAYMVAPIDKVLTGSAYADVVGFAGTGANALVIDQNSLLPYTEQEELNQFSSGLLTQVATVPEYRPGTLSGYANPTINPGDVIYVDNDDDEMEPVCVTQVTESGFQLTITSSGNQRRDVQNFTSVSLQAVKRTVDQLREQTGKFPDQWAQDIENTVKAITGAMGGTRVDLFNPDTGLPSGTAYCLDGDGLSTAKNVLVINAGGIAFYDNGFDADNPESNVPAYVVMNNQGKVDASSILTGILTAIIIKSADGESFYADLQKGIVRMKVTEFTVQGKTVDEIAKEKADAALTEANKQLQDYASTVTDSLSDLQGQIDGQIQTWFYNYVPTASNAPASDWTTDADKTKHLGDLFYIVDNTESAGQAYRWAQVNGEYKWVLIEDTEVAKALASAAKAQDTADGKRTVFTSQPVPPYSVGDLWSQGPSGSLLVCKTARSSGSYAASDWQNSADYINEITAQQVADDAVGKIELGVTNADAFYDILGDTTWTEPHGLTVLDGTEVTLKGGTNEAWVSLYVPTENLQGLAGKRIRITLEYQIQEAVGGAACRNTLWYVYKNEAGGGYYINTITTGTSVEASSQWHKVSWETTLKNDIVTKLQLTANLGAGGYGTVKFRNVTFEAVAGVRSAVSLSKEGVQISVATLGDYATASDYASLRLSQSDLSLTVVKDGEVRSKFAADTNSVTIDSGQITFSGNTLVIDSTNFKLASDGTVQITGTFTSQTDIDRTYIGSGQLHMERKTNDGNWRTTGWLYSNGQNSAFGNFQLYGQSGDGSQVPMISMGTNYAGGSIYMFRSDKSAYMSCYPDTRGNPYFALTKPGGQASGRWLVDTDGRGHLVTPIIELEKIKAYGATHTCEWVYFSSLGRTVLCATN